MRNVALFVTAFVAVSALPHASFAKGRGASDRSVAQTAPAAAPSIRLVEITTARIQLRDLFSGASAMPDVDLGPTPPLGSSRTIDREQILRALATAKVAATSLKVPAQVRVVRKAKKLTPSDLDQLVRTAIDPSRLPKGSTVAAIRANAIEVPDGFDHVVVELPTPPRRAGSVTVNASVAFMALGDLVARVTLPIELSVPQEALIPDVAKGSPITLMIRHGLVEVSAPAVASSDGDTGSIVSVLVKGSGHVIRARIVDKDHALAIGES